MNKALVSWSGGVDSTYLIYDYLEKGYEVDAVYTKLDCNKHKSERELDAIKKMRQLYFDKNKKFSFRQQNIDICPANSSTLRLPQALLWITSLAYSYSSEHTEVAIGYIMNDDAISYLHDIRDVWESIKPLFYNLPNIKFPLIKVAKTEAYYHLPEILKNNVTWCEVERKDINIHTCECPPCLRMQRIIPKCEPVNKRRTIKGRKK